MLEYFLLSRLSTNNFAYDVCILLFVIPMLTYFTHFIKTDLISIIINWNYNRWNIINFDGWDNLYNGIFFFDYPKPMISICYYVTSRNLAPNLRFFNQNRNNVFYSDCLSKCSKENNSNYLIDNKFNIKINNDIFLDFLTHRIDTKTENNNQSGGSNISWKVSLKIKSKTLSCLELKEFVDKCMEEFDTYEKNKTKDKIFHFIFQKFDSEKDKLQFSQNIFTDLKNESDSSFETFNSLFSEHKEYIINSVKRLKDVSYFKRTGSKRKLGFLFHGSPGCGKTAHVSAIANFDKRHILEVPMSRVKTNRELEEIINLTQINNVTFKKEELIIFFDEIDQANKTLQQRDGEQKENDNDKENNDELKNLLLKNIKSKNTSEQISQQNDELNLGNILSRLDGIGNYNGLIIIAATNCIDKLSPALYRSGRLTALKFDFCRKEDIINMIEFYYQIKLSKDETQSLPDRKHKISPASLKKYMEENEKNYKELLIKLKSKVI